MRHRPSTYSRAWPQSRVEIAETEAFLPAKLIAAAARVILRVTKVLPRRELRDRIGFRSTNAFVGFAAIALNGAGYHLVVAAVAHDEYRALSDDRLIGLVAEGGTLADLKGMWRDRDFGSSVDRWAL